jgi:hypothetical protein
MDQRHAAEIANLIVDASYRSADEFRTFINDNWGEQQAAAKYQHIASEFLFAFVHMADRVMQSDRGVSFRDSHIDLLATLVIREKVRRQHSDAEPDTFETAVTLLGLDANDAHAIYENYAEIFVKDKPFTGGGIVNRLARFVCRDLDSKNNIELHRMAIAAFASLSAALNLRKLIASQS